MLIARRNVLLRLSIAMVCRSQAGSAASKTSLPRLPSAPPRRSAATLSPTARAVAPDGPAARRARGDPWGDASPDTSFVAGTIAPGSTPSGRCDVRTITPPPVAPRLDVPLPRLLLNLDLTLAEAAFPVT